MESSASPAGEIHRHSGWTIPASLALVVLVLCGLFLLYYLRPAPGLLRGNDPTVNGTPVALSIEGAHFVIPANYLQSRTARRGGAQKAVALTALLPGMRGYTAASAALFAGNAADSPLVHMLLRADSDSIAPSARLARIYGPYLASPHGQASLFGLTHYDFRAGTGYGDDDLYAGDSAKGLLLLLCERAAQDLPNPNCLAVNRAVAPGVGLSYRFKRAQLSQWRQIAANVDRLVDGFVRR